MPSNWSNIGKTVETNKNSFITIVTLHTGFSGNGIFENDYKRTLNVNGNWNHPKMFIFILITMQIIHYHTVNRLRKSHWLLRMVYDFIFTAAFVYMAWMTSRKLHCDVMETHYSWRHHKFFRYVFTVECLLNWSVFLVYSFWINLSLVWSF